MNLLPKLNSEFSYAKYWESFFKKRKHSFEWYGNYLELCGILHRYIKAKDDILNVGCGNSELSEHLYDSGFHKVTNIDISKTVLEKMRKRNEKRVGMSWIKMDLANLTLTNDSMSVVLDKGTLDALMSDSSDEANLKIQNIFKELNRVLRFGGRYICITLAQDHILNALLSFFPDNNWIVRIHKVWTAESDDKINMPVFAFVFTKFKTLAEKLFEICLEDDVKPIRLNSVTEAIDIVKTQQYYAMMRRKLAHESQDEPVAVTLFSSDNIDVPRYTIHVIDTENQKYVNKFGVFIVPRGREREWLFNSNEGRRQVADSAQFKRLAFVSLSRDHAYAGLQQIQNELSSKVMELAPIDLPRQYKAPFLSVGKDAVGEQRIRYKSQSSITGSVIVEDYLGEGEMWFRQLLFDSSLVQTAVKLTKKQTIKSRRKKNKKDVETSFEVDPSYFASQYLQFIVAGITGLIDSRNSQFRSLILGLGGGSLALHLLHFFKCCHVTAVEIDPLLVEISQNWFGLSKNKFGKRLDLKTDDALNYIASAIVDEHSLYHNIILDIDTKDESLVLRCPPEQFLTDSFLQKIKDILSDEGVFFVNLASRDQTAKNEAIEKLKNVFPHIFMIKCTEDINVVLYCFKANKSSITSENIITQWQNKAKTRNETDKELDVSDSFKELLQI